MNFMLKPQPCKVANGEMTPKQLETAEKFVDKLISLRVLVSQQEENILNNFPLFLVPKPRQPGEWRCIADGRRGGQNDVCLSDPLHLLQPQDILPRLYPGGYSALVDASKYFHMFKTRKDEWKYLGVQHPRTGKWYTYSTLPMGTRQSPAAACKFGNGFLRTVMNTHPAFQGHPCQNDFASDLQGTPFDPLKGNGRVLMGADGHPSVLLFMHVDDILVHGPNQEKTVLGLNHLMDTALRLGLICQPVKTKAPRQWQKILRVHLRHSTNPLFVCPSWEV